LSRRNCDCSSAAVGCCRSLLLFGLRLHFECLLFFHFDLPPLPRQSPFDLRGSILQFRHLGFLKLQNSGLLINLLLLQRDLRVQIFQTFRLLLDLPLHSSFVLLELRLNLHQFLGLVLQLLLASRQLSQMRLVTLKLPVDLQFLSRKVIGVRSHLVTDRVQRVNEFVDERVAFGFH
jgi:hypothetical protein